MSFCHLSVTDFVCPSSRQTVPMDVISGTPERQAAWVSANTTYVYTGAGSFSSADSATVWLYEDPSIHSGHLWNSETNVVFADGHVEFVGGAALHMIAELQQGHNPPRK
jgi:prepilin-type processing-associated H-X9-DG protein